MDNTTTITRRTALRRLGTAAAAASLPAAAIAGEASHLRALIDEHKAVTDAWNEAWGRFGDAEDAFCEAEAALRPGQMIPCEFTPDGHVVARVAVETCRSDDSLREHVERHHDQMRAKFLSEWAKRVSPTAARELANAISASQDLANAAVTAFIAERDARKASFGVQGAEEEVDRWKRRGDELADAILAYSCRTADDALAKALWWMAMAADVQQSGFEPPDIDLAAFVVKG